MKRKLERGRCKIHKIEINRVNDYVPLPLNRIESSWVSDPTELIRQKH